MSKPAPARPRSRSTQKDAPNPRYYFWVGGGIALLIFIVVGVIIWRQTAFPFSFVGGEQHAVVLKDNRYDAEYQIEYTGDQPASLERVIVQLESPQPVLHVDIRDVTIILDGVETTLEGSGHVPEGVQLTLQPGEVFTIRVTYLGQTIGAHYVYGFKIGYQAEGRYVENALNIKDREFTVIVE